MSQITDFPPLMNLRSSVSTAIIRFRLLSAPSRRSLTSFGTPTFLRLHTFEYLKIFICIFLFQCLVQYIPRPSEVYNLQQFLVGKCRSRLSARLLDTQSEMSGDLGGAVWWFREHCAGHHWYIHHFRSNEMVSTIRTSYAASSWIWR